MNIKELLLNGCKVPINKELKSFKDSQSFIENYIAMMKSLDLKRDDHVVLFENKGMSHSALVAFYLRMFSATNVRVLNGGLNKWLKEKK